MLHAICSRRSRERRRLGGKSRLDAEAVSKLDLAPGAAGSAAVPAAKSRRDAGAPGHLFILSSLLHSNDSIFGFYYSTVGRSSRLEECRVEDNKAADRRRS
jgi:hypothetical protein